MSAPALRRSLISALPRIVPTKPIPSFAIASRRWASDAPDNGTSDKPPNSTGAMGHIADILRTTSPRSPRTRSALPTSPLSPRESAAAMVGVATDFDPSSSGFDLFSLASAPVQEDDYHFHIFSTKHNTHITFTKPDKGAIVSKSAGNLGFKKSQRGTYDAAYQLAAYVFKAIEDKNIRPRGVEVVLRGFGQGREAAVKALLGQEGKFLRPVVRRVTDSTRLKFGGTRSKKPRRLG